MLTPKVILDLKTGGIHTYKLYYNKLPPIITMLLVIVKQSIKATSYYSTMIMSEL